MNKKISHFACAPYDEEYAKNHNYKLKVKCSSCDTFVLLTESTAKLYESIPKKLKTVGCPGCTLKKMKKMDKTKEKYKIDITDNVKKELSKFIAERIEDKYTKYRGS